MINKRTRDTLKKIINESTSINEILLKLDINGYNYPKNKLHLCKYLQSIFKSFGTNFDHMILLKKWQKDNINEIVNIEIIKSWYFSKQQLPSYAKNLLEIWEKKHIDDYLKKGII